MDQAHCVIEGLISNLNVFSIWDFSDEFAVTCPDWFCVIWNWVWVAMAIGSIAGLSNEKNCNKLLDHFSIVL